MVVSCAGYARDASIGRVVAKIGAGVCVCVWDVGDVLVAGAGAAGIWLGAGKGRVDVVAGRKERYRVSSYEIGEEEKRAVELGPCGVHGSDVFRF